MGYFYAELANLFLHVKKISLTLIDVEMGIFILMLLSLYLWNFYPSYRSRLQFSYKIWPLTYFEKSFIRLAVELFQLPPLIILFLNIFLLFLVEGFHLKDFGLMCVVLFNLILIFDLMKLGIEGQFRNKSTFIYIFVILFIITLILFYLNKIIDAEILFFIFILNSLIIVSVDRYYDKKAFYSSDKKSLFSLSGKFLSVYNAMIFNNSEVKKFLFLNNLFPRILLILYYYLFFIKKHYHLGKYIYLALLIIPIGIFSNFLDNLWGFMREWFLLINLAGKNILEQILEYIRFVIPLILFEFLISFIVAWIFHVEYSLFLFIFILTTILNTQIGMLASYMWSKKIFKISFKNRRSNASMKAVFLNVSILPIASLILQQKWLGAFFLICVFEIILIFLFVKFKNNFSRYKFKVYKEIF
jgi:hypothetical protein